MSALLLLCIYFCIFGGTGTAFAIENAPDRESVADEWQRQLKKYSEIYSHVAAHYPEKVEKEKLVFGSISGILRALDPHSYFLDSVSVRSMNEDQQGNYYGIGTRITKYEDRLTVIAPLAGTPAYRMGIMAGDVIAEIEGKDTRKISLDNAMRMLRGAKGTTVNIKIRRDGIKELIPYSIDRAEIPLNSVSYALTHPDAPEVGFISIRTFGNTTARELEKSILKLVKEQGIKALILDLRGNAGGSLYAAIDVADFFLPKGKVIVVIQGRSFRQSFSAKKDNQFEAMPLAVLINRGSASASEIVASSMQDHGRAKIVGSRSWGKGLVQTISRLSLNTSLALTTAKYYTPDNKSIQREFNQRDDYFFFLNNKNYDTDTSIVGGVIPDVPLKPEFYPGPIINFISRGTFFKFARHLVDSGFPVTRSFEADSRVIDRFRAFLDERKISYKPVAFEKHMDTIRVEIEREVLSHKFSPDEGVKAFLKTDKVAREALEILKNNLKKN